MANRKITVEVGIVFDESFLALLPGEDLADAAIDAFWVAVMEEYGNMKPRVIVEDQEGSDTIYLNPK